MAAETWTKLAATGAEERPVDQVVNGALQPLVDRVRLLLRQSLVGDRLGEA